MKYVKDVHVFDATEKGRFKVEFFQTQEEIKAYKDWLLDKGIIAAQNILDTQVNLIHQETDCGWDYSTALPADMFAPHFYHVCFMHHGVTFCALIVAVDRDNPKHFYVNEVEFNNQMRESEGAPIVPCFFPLYKDTGEPVLPGKWPLLTMGHDGAYPMDVESQQLEDAAELSPLEMQIIANSLVIRHFGSLGYENFSHCEVLGFSPEIRCKKDGAEVAVWVKASPTGLVDEPYEINIRQKEAANAEMNILVEIIFDFFIGNNGDFNSKQVNRGCRVMLGCHQNMIWSVEDALQNRPNIKLVDHEAYQV